MHDDQLGKNDYLCHNKEKKHASVMNYYISHSDGRYQGPIKKEQLLANGLDRDTMVWREGLQAWTPALQLPELSDLIDDIPPPMEITLGGIDQEPPALPLVDEPQAQPQAQATQDKEVLVTTIDKASEPKKELATPKAVETKNKEKKNIAKTDKKEKEKKKKKTKYDYPVCEWLRESVFLLACVIVHAALAISGSTTQGYLYLDIVGAVLSITGIIIALYIKKLNKISHAKDSPSRLKAQKLGTFNGFLVSATAAIGFLIILVQSAHYVYAS